MYREKGGVWGVGCISGDYYLTTRPARARTFSIDEKKALNRLKALWCMVGRERFERSTSGLKVRCSTN